MELLFCAFIGGIVGICLAESIDFLIAYLHKNNISLTGIPEGDFDNKGNYIGPEATIVKPLKKKVKRPKKC